MQANQEFQSAVNDAEMQANELIEDALLKGRLRRVLQGHPTRRSPNLGLKKGQAGLLVGT